MWSRCGLPQPRQLAFFLDAVRAHAKAFTSVNSTQAELITAFSRLHDALNETEGDMLPLLEAHYGLGTVVAPTIESVSANVGDEDFAEEVHVDPAEARVERVRQWRLAAVRGSSASTFRQKVTIIRLKHVECQLVMRIGSFILGCGFRNQFSQRHLLKYVHAQNLQDLGQTQVQP